MTEPLPPLSDGDLSAVLDGEAATDVTERAQADPVAQARIDAFRTARDSLRAAPVPALDRSVVDELVARALDQTDAPATSGALVTDGGGPDADPSEDADPDDASADEVVVPLAPPRGRSGGAPRWLVAAAIVALVAIGLGLIWSGRDDRGTETAEVNPSAGQFDADDASGAGAGGGAEDNVAAEENTDVAAEPPIAPDPGVPTTSPGGPPGTADPARSVTDLGPYASLEDLRTSLGVSFPTERLPLGPGVGPSAAAIDRCQLLMMEVFDLPSEATRFGQATIEGEDLLVFEFAAPSAADGSPTTFLTVNEPTSCDARLSFER